MDGLVALLAALFGVVASLGGVWLKSTLDQSNARKLATEAAMDARTEQGKTHASAALLAANRLDQAIQYEYAEEDTTGAAIDLSRADLRALSDAAILVPDAELRDTVNKMIFALHSADRLASLSDGWSRPLEIQSELVSALREVLAAHVRGDGSGAVEAARIADAHRRVMASILGKG